MAQGLFEKIFVLCKERHSAEPVQKGNQIFVLDSCPGDFFANLPEGDAPLS